MANVADADPSTVAAAAPVVSTLPGKRGRLVGLDGIRGMAALFVVVHHCYLLAFPGYPASTGPFWSGFLIYGQFAVVVFIVLSGFSLSVSPARKEWQLGSKSRFAVRRAWRILPPYWAALAFSLVIAWTIVPQPGELAPTGKSVVVYGLLLQDITGSPSPNGAMWSIAIEAQLYVVFPLLLLLVRRVGALAMVAAVSAIVAAIGLVGPHVSIVDALMRLTPQLGALFAVGIVAAGILRAGERLRRVPWHWLALIAVAPVIALIAINGSEWTIRNFLWVDLALGPAIGCLLAGLVTDRPAALVWLLDTRPIRSLGSFSYSLYLIHAPIVVAVYVKLVAPRLHTGVAAFFVTVAIAGSISVVGARLFAAVFELPFQRHRSWSALRAAINARLGRTGSQPGAAAIEPPMDYPARHAAPVPAALPAERAAEQLPAAVCDDELLAAQVHPVDG